MDNPYKPPKTAPKRVFHTPIIVPISIVMVIGVYVGYSLFYQQWGENSLLITFQSISFELFLLCDVGMIVLTAINQRILKGFLQRFPVVDDGIALEQLKLVARTNMYSALLNFLFLALGALMAIMTIIHYSYPFAITVVVLSILVSVMNKWYSKYEEAVKHIETANDVLETETAAVLDCWMHKALPNF